MSKHKKNNPDAPDEAQADPKDEGRYAEAKRLLAEGSIGAITLDTSVFFRNGLNLETGLLPELAKVDHRRTRVLLTDIVIRELTKHLSTRAKERHSAAITALRELADSWGRDKRDVPKAVCDFEREVDQEDIAKKRVDAFIRLVNAEIVETNGAANLGQVLDQYFDSQPPFEQKEKKKNEFPDALALSTLEQWSKLNRTGVLAVSADGGWLTRCDEVDGLVGVRELKLALEALQDPKNLPLIERLASKFDSGDPEGWRDEITSYVESKAVDLQFHVTADAAFHFDYELDDIGVESVDLGDLSDVSKFVLVGSTHGEFLVSIQAKVCFRAEASFDFSVYDSIDKDSMTIGGTVAETTQSETLELLVDVLIEDGDLSIGDVQIIRKYITLDFGSVGPDYHDEES